MKTFTPRSLTKVLSMFLLLFAYGDAQATHAQSADITYTCLGGNNYNLKLSFYRDCAGIAAPNNVTINISSVTCAQNYNVTLNRVPGTGIDVTPICPTQTTNCNGGNYPGVQEWVYSGNITLPMQCMDWVFSFNLCCRNNAISTINNPGGENIYVEAQLDNLNFACNNSAQFSNKPVPFICVNQTYCFNHGATDSDGDSLVYQLIPPKTSPTTTVTYLPGYSANQPMMSNPAVTFNTATGDICMTPSQLDVTVMAVKVSEWRNGEFIGSVIRDIQVRIINCTNNNPYISGINGNPVFTAGTCAGQQMQFSIFSFDNDPGQNLTLTWNNAIPGATFTTNTAQHPTATFTWTPTAAQISNNPYCFTVTVTDDNCPLNGTQTYSFCITVSGFNINATSTNANCGASNGTVSVAVSGGNAPYQYQWSMGNTTANVNGVAAGTYYINVADASGCVMSDTAIVGQGAAPGNIQMSMTPVACYGGNSGTASVNVNGGQQPYTYSWNNGGTTNSISGLTAGTYQVSVTTANGCMTSGSIQVTQPNAALNGITTQTNITCNGANNGSANVSANGGTGPYTFTWNTNPPQSTATINNLSAGTYAVTIQDANGCTTIAPSVTITQPNAIAIAQVNNTPVSCYNGTNGSATVNASGGSGNFQYSWNTTPVQNTATASNLAAGNYTVTATDANGCSQTFTTTITQPTQLSAAISNLTNVNCNGSNSGSATVGGIGGTAPYTYSWNTTPMQTTATATQLSGGTYTGTVTDAHGCTATANVPINEPSALSVSNSGNDTICPGNSSTISVTVNGGTAPYTYTWNNGLGNSNTHAVSPSSTTTYAVTINDANGCTLPVQNMTVKVNDINQLYFNVTATSNICLGEAAIVMAELSGGIGNYNMTWNNNLPNGYGPYTVYPTSSGFYTATVTDICGNSRIESAWVEVHPLPAVQLNPQSLNECARVSANFTNDLQNPNGYSYFWNFGDGTTSTAEFANHNYQQSGNYQITLTVTSAQGCTASDSTTFNIVVRPQAVADFTIENRELSIFDPTVKVFNQSSNYTQSQWNFGDGFNTQVNSPTHKYANEGTYTITLIVNNTHNCPDTTSDYVVILPEFTFYVPNAFTPDGDGKNDMFMGKGDHVGEFEMLIFNRWGENIFATQNVNQGWDGTYRNEPSQADVYVYKITIRDDIKGHYHYLSGHVTLVK